MRRSARLLLLAAVAGLWACAQESPVGTKPDAEPPEILRLRIAALSDTLRLMLHDFAEVTATVVRADDAPLLPQPAIEWSLSPLARPRPTPWTTRTSRGAGDGDAVDNWGPDPG
jgi:hypothetical protein